MDIKSENIGKKVYSKNLKSLVELNDKSKDIFIREGRFDLFESVGLDELKPMDQVEKPKKKTRKKRNQTDDIPTESND